MSNNPSEAFVQKIKYIQSLTHLGHKNRKLKYLNDEISLQVSNSICKEQWVRARQF